MCKSHTKKIGALKLSQQDVGKNCFFRGCVQQKKQKKQKKQETERVISHSGHLNGCHIFCFSFFLPKKKQILSFSFFEVLFFLLHFLPPPRLLPLFFLVKTNSSFPFLLLSSSLFLLRKIVELKNLFCFLFFFCWFSCSKATFFFFFCRFVEWKKE